MTEDVTKTLEEQLNAVIDSLPASDDVERIALAAQVYLLTVVRAGGSFETAMVSLQLIYDRIQLGREGFLKQYQDQLEEAGLDVEEIIVAGNKKANEELN